MNPVLRDSLDKMPWWARLLVSAGLAFGVGYAAGGEAAGLAALLAWALGNQQDSVQKTKKDQDYLNHRIK